MKNLKINKFSGLGETGDGYCAAEMRNFRLTENRLRKRCGYRFAAELPGEVRAVWSGIIRDEYYIFAVAADIIYRIFPDWSFTPAGSLNSASGGSVCFFFYSGELLILDGDAFYVYRAGVFKISPGYVPQLYNRASMYSPPQIDAQDEPVNMLTRRVRIGYICNGVNAEVFVRYRLESIDALFLSGQKLNPSEYNFENYENGCIISLTNKPSINYTIEVNCLIEAGALREVGSCHTAIVYGGANNSTLFCFGGDDKSKIYYNRTITEDMLTSARNRYPDCGELYFPATNIFYVGDGRYDVTAACRHYDRLLIFTENDAWVTDFSSSKFEDYPAVPINSSVGCRALFGAHLAGNNPLTLSDGGIYRWTSNTSQRDECNASLISSPIEKHCGRDYFEGAVSFLFRGRNEFWISNPDVYPGCFVYSFKREGSGGEWYYFDGFRADGFFDYHGEAGFFEGRRIFVFDEAQDTDIPAAGISEDIDADWISHYLDFGEAEAIKRVLRVKLFGSAEDGGRIDLSCSTDRHFDRLFQFEFEKSGRPQHFSRRGAVGRHNYLNLRISSSDGKRPVVREVQLISGGE